MSISFSYEELDTEELHNSDAVELSGDFDNKRQLKKHIKSVMENFNCQSCGGHRLDGDNIIVEFCKIKLFGERVKRGFFGKKYVDDHQKSIYRVSNIYLRPGGFFSSAGYIRCKSCDWEQKGEKGVKWISYNDFTNGNF